MLNIYVTFADCECIAVGENSGDCDLDTDQAKRCYFE